MPDNSLQKQHQSQFCTAEESIGLTRSGQRVFIGSSCGETQHLVNALMDNANYFSDVALFVLQS
jgi:acyl-CoA hydrolase